MLSEQLDKSGQINAFQGIIGGHSLMRHLYELIDLVAATDVTVHIHGESGVGKELVADAIHNLSARKNKRFVKINCSSIPSTLLESALFGHVKGAFTDAHKDAAGYIEHAEGGTIFLDEIGEISHEMQVKLLRLLQTHEYSRVGETIVRRANIRVITATNRDLEELVLKGRIREDFYYRINVFPLQIPPLRARTSDIEQLASFFIEKFNRKFGKNVQGVSNEVHSVLESYSWPGNVRELENAFEHAFVLVRGPLVELEHLPPNVRKGGLAGTSHLSQQVDPKARAESERRAIKAALEKANGNKTHAAKLLGISRVTLWKKLGRMSDSTVSSQSTQLAVYSSEPQPLEAR